MTWLPQDEWVMQRWLPFDTVRLTSQLRMNRTEIVRALLADDVTLEDLARRRGLSPSLLLRRLTAPRRRGARHRQSALLRERTARVLRQGHLAEHMLGHFYHHWAITQQAQVLFGVSPNEYAARFHEGLTPAAIAWRSGVGADELYRRLISVLGAVGRRGQALGAWSSAERRAVETQHREGLRRWMHVAPFARAARASRKSSAPVLCRLVSPARG